MSTGSADLLLQSGLDSLTCAPPPADSPDDAVNEPLLTVLGCVCSIDVQGLEHSEGQTL
jgi:hypothetical protein